MSLIENEITKIRTDVPRLAKLREEYLFSLVCYKYFYNKGELSFKDYSEIFVDGKDDGGIDLVQVVDDSNDQPALYLIQSKNISNLANYNDIIDVFRKMITTIENFKNGGTAQYSKKLRQKLKDKLSEIDESSSSIVLVLFLNTDVSIDRRKKIEKDMKENEVFDQYTTLFYDKTQINSTIESILSPKRYVDEAAIKISKKDGKIKYGQNGLMVNVHASSIKDLYDRYSERGLFEQNFRYFIKNKKIDDNINSSLDKKRDKFWFLNNGIIIGCEDFDYDNENVKLYKFSIINGCQTATLIGEYDGISEKQDFVLPCKIIKPNDGSSEEVFLRFISEVAESSNSQKPISDRDLKSNTREQRDLQEKLREADPKIYLEIKRGEEKKKGIANWQSLTNDLYGQIILSFNLQQPGTARSFKKRIFGDDNIYYKVFRRKIDKEAIVDLLKLHFEYQKYLNNQLEKESFDTTMENVATNGKFTILAIIGFLIKIKRKIVQIENPSSDEWIKNLQTDNITGKLFLENLDDNFDKTLQSLFVEIISELSDIYNKKEETYKTVSNLFKLDKYYNEDILSHIIKRYVNNPTKKEEIDNYLNILFR